MKTYSEMLQYVTYEDRLRYLSLDGVPCNETFGPDRWINQKFYMSSEWKRLRNHIIARDYGCDLAIKDLYISGSIYIHHMNPISVDDIVNRTNLLLDPEFLICVTYNTHQMIHYGRAYLNSTRVIIERSKNDLYPWK